MEGEPKNPEKKKTGYEKKTPHELEAEKKRLEKEIAEKEKKIKEKERIIEEGKERIPRLKRAEEKLRAKKEKAEKKLKEEQKKAKEYKEGAEKAKERLKQTLAQVKTGYFVELTPKRKFTDPEFMRYVPGDKYMALMESHRLTDAEKEHVTRARFKFCMDWIEHSPEMKEYEKKKGKYKEAFDEWLAHKDAPIPEILRKPEPQLPYQETPTGREIRETFRNDIRNIKELIHINNYMPEMFDQFAIVGHIRFPMIQDIRKNEAFAGRGRHIREAKVTDFIDIIEHVEKILGPGTEKDSKKYFDTFSVEQLEVLRKRMKSAFDGKERKEIAGIGSRSWQSPITLDLMDRTVLQGFRDSDEGDKRIIVKHLLLAYKAGEKMSEQNKDALRWLISVKEGPVFYNVVNVAEEVSIDLRKEINIEEIAQKLGVKVFSGIVVD